VYCRFSLLFYFIIGSSYYSTENNKWYLSENYGVNEFRMVLCHVKQHRRHKRHRDGTNHPKVLSGEAFWFDESKLCIGYELYSNRNIFRPIFSHKRQRLLEFVHLDIICPTAFWHNVKRRYYVCMSKIKKLPLECVAHIVNLLVITL